VSEHQSKKSFWLLEGGEDFPRKSKKSHEPANQKERGGEKAGKKSVKNGGGQGINGKRLLYVIRVGTTTQKKERKKMRA